MLTWNKVLNRIKSEMCLPNHVMEKTDKDIISYLTLNTLPKLDDYYPDKSLYYFNPDHDDVKVLGRSGAFYIYDDDERDIIGVTEFVGGGGMDMIFGRLPLTPLSWETVPMHELGNYTADNSRMFSGTNINIHFEHPNVFTITPVPQYTMHKCIVIYERSHAQDLSTVPKTYESVFIELCLGMFMRNIGRLRSRYQNIQTAFGEINLSSDDLKSEGAEIYQSAIDQLKRSELTNIIFDRG